MRKLIVGALLLATCAISQAHAKSSPDALIGKWELWGANGRRAGTFEFGPLANGVGTLIMTDTSGGEPRMASIKYKAVARGARILIQPVREGGDDFACLTIELIAADAARVRRHDCTKQPDGPAATIRRTGPSTLR